MNKATFATGIVGLAVGALPFLTLMGVLPAGHRSPNDAPDWLGVLFGLMFLFAGFLAIIRSFAGNEPNGDLPAAASPVLRIVNYGLGFAVVVGLATMFSWVAFGPGDRHFTVSGGGFATQTSGSGDILGRVAFGFGATLGWFMVGTILVMAVRRWLSRR